MKCRKQEQETQAWKRLVGHGTMVKKDGICCHWLSLKLENLPVIYDSKTGSNWQLCLKIEQKLCELPIDPFSKPQSAVQSESSQSFQFGMASLGFCSIFTHKKNGLKNPWDLCSCCFYTEPSQVSAGRHRRWHALVAQSRSSAPHRRNHNHRAPSWVSVSMLQPWGVLEKNSKWRDF